MPVARFFFTPEFKKKNRNQQADRQTDRQTEANQRE